jgi:hypothetical protein
MARVDTAGAARSVIEDCKTDSGFHASSEHYPELWVRDLVYSEDRLLALGYHGTIKSHLESFLKLQRTTGQLPTVITTTARRIMNQRFHFWTADGEILFIIGLLKLANFGAGDLTTRYAPQIKRTLGYINGRLNGLGFILGMDWRDAIPNYRGRALLANQLLLLEMYELLQQADSAASLREGIAKAFYLGEEGYFADSIWWENGNLNHDGRFDSLGNSLAILLDVFPEASPRVASCFSIAKTPHGYRNIFPPLHMERLGCLKSVGGMNAFLRNGAVFRNREGNYQNSAIWPFVESRILKALSKEGMHDDARSLAQTMNKRDGFNEWYSPGIGEPRGSKGQLWTAAAALDAVESAT